jgi:hypothetical protein
MEMLLIMNRRRHVFLVKQAQARFYPDLIMMAASFWPGHGRCPAAGGTSGLGVNEFVAGSTLTSPDGSYVFAHQLTERGIVSGYVALWASNTGGNDDAGHAGGWEFGLL